MSASTFNLAWFTKLLVVSGCMWICIMMGTFAGAQGFPGSTGKDGALDYSQFPPGTYVFDPSKFIPPLDPTGDNIFNFTTINIPSGITVVLSGRVLHGPVFWLTTGDVYINGVINLSGENGAVQSFNLDQSARAQPGAGGFSGGSGGKCDPASTSPQPLALPGDGPQGGAAGTCPQSSASAGAGGFQANDSLIPLVGGSGGGGWTAIGPAGATLDSVQYGAGGGAGGGALLIASPTQIYLNGGIFANGGQGQYSSDTSGTGASGSGAGGAIRLVAPVISGSGVAEALGAVVYSRNSGANGFIRLDTLNDATAHNFGGTPFAVGSTLNVFPPTIHPPSITVVSVDTVTLPQPPSGGALPPDVSINTTSPVTVTIQASYIPLGTVLTLHVRSDNNTEQTVRTTALSGTFESSTATFSVTFPTGFSLNYVKATWSQ